MRAESAQLALHEGEQRAPGLEHGAVDLIVIDGDASRSSRAVSSETTPIESISGTAPISGVSALKPALRPCRFRVSSTRLSSCFSILTVGPALF